MYTHMMRSARAWCVRLLMLIACANRIPGAGGTLLRVNTSDTVCRVQASNTLLRQIITPIDTTLTLGDMKTRYPSAFRECTSMSRAICPHTYSNESYQCDSSSHEALNSDWGHCVGLHEALMLSQSVEQRPTKLPAVQDVVDMLGQIGVVIAVTGPPGVGKSTLTALAAYYGMRMVDLEDVHGGDKLSKQQARNAALAHAIDVQRTQANYAALSEPSAQSNASGAPSRPSMVVGLCAVTRIGSYSSLSTDKIITMLLRPRTSTMEERWLSRRSVVHDDQQARRVREQIREHPSGYQILQEADAHIQSEGCAEHILRDVGIAAILWLAQGAESAAQSCMPDGYSALRWEGGRAFSPTALQVALRRCQLSRQQHGARFLEMSATYRLDVPRLIRMASLLQEPVLNLPPTRFIAIAWGCAKPLWPQMVDFARKFVAPGDVSAGCALRLGNHDALQRFVQGVYAVEAY